MSEVTPEMVALRTIAATLDHPSAYMGGPSERNMRRAEQIFAAVAPLVAEAERERCAAYHDEAAQGERVLQSHAAAQNDKAGATLHAHLATEHELSAAAIRALGSGS